ncbi:MAG TPA: hypothetical protein DCX53_02885 [Anaerolineae bacterium]|nr:hypothetical protein [Anaerolineae bacterium]
MDDSLVPDEFFYSLLDLCNSVEWRKTTTYPPHLEHEYILIEKQPELVLMLCKAIDEYGYDEIFYSKTYRYLTLGNFRYWHFDTLVNRETLEKYNARKKM